MGILDLRVNLATLDPQSRDCDARHTLLGYSTVGSVIVR
jgi:hypothetical protein